MDLCIPSGTIGVLNQEMGRKTWRRYVKALNSKTNTINIIEINVVGKSMHRSITRVTKAFISPWLLEPSN